MTLSLAPLKRLLDGESFHRGDVCESCGAAITSGHHHVADIDARRLHCVCAACFTQFEGSGERLRAAAPRYVRLPADLITAEDWDAWQIPVGIAFIFYNSKLARTVACYPSPAGAVTSLLSLENWDQLVLAHPLLRTVRPDVEALLLRTHDGVRDCFIVPIETCYELVGRIRTCWTGFGGGSALAEIESFFAELANKSTRVSA